MFGTRKQPHDFPANEDEVTAYIEQMREEWRIRHEERMKEWEHFKTEEYKNEVTEYLLSTTHADIEPPWLKDPAEQDNLP